jgi:D-alanyl-D-alanine carboxypeptidase
MNLPALAVVVVLVAGACGSTVAPPASGGASAPSSPPSLAPTPAGPSAAPTGAVVELLGALPGKALDATNATALQGVLEAAVSHGAPDAIAAVITPRGTWAGAAGIGGPDGRAATSDDTFYLASVTQVFTAALIMRLAEQGTIDLDSPIWRYLGDLDVDTGSATVREALGMRSGLPDLGDDAVAAQRADGRRVWTADEIAPFVGAPSATARSTYLHSGPNYWLLALAAEHATGRSFAAALRDNVLDPVRADGILQQGAGVPTPRPWALPTQAYLGPWKLEDYGFGDVISCPSSVSFAFGAGSMAGTAPSVAAWAWHLFAGDVVSEASLRAMLPALPDRHGFGLHEMADLGNRLVLGITGQKTGYGSFLGVVPAEGTVVVLFVNNPDFIVEPYVIQLIEASREG